MIDDPSGKKRLLAFRALVATTTVQSVARGDAGKTQVQWKRFAATKHLSLGERAEWSDDLDAKTERLTGDGCEVVEELWCGIGKWVVVKRADGNRINTVERTENSRFGKQQ